MNEKPDTWKRERSESVADCRVFRVRKDFSRRASDGSEHDFFVIENPDWVNIIALTPEKEVVLIEQFRHGTEEVTLEIPGGMVDDGETPEAAARRELVEETGFSADEFYFLGKSRPNPAIQSNWIYHFAALRCRKIQETAFDQHECLDETASTEIYTLLIVGSELITHSLVLAGFYKLNLLFKNL